MKTLLLGFCSKSSINNKVRKEELVSEHQTAKDLCHVKSPQPRLIPTATFLTCMFHQPQGSVGGVWINHCKTNSTAEKRQLNAWGEESQLSQSTFIPVFVVKRKRCQNETKRSICVWFNRFAQNVTSKIFGLPKLLNRFSQLQPDMLLSIFFFTLFSLYLLRVSCSVTSDSLRPCGLQHTRLLHPWNSPGKNTGMGCHSLLHKHFLIEKLIF